MDLVNQTTVLLMARSGSKRLSNKNMATFGPEQEKTTLLEWKINQLLEVFAPNQIILSSDSSDYLDIGSKFGLQLHMRGKDLTDYGSFADNLRTVAQEAKTKYVMYSNGPCNPLIGPKRIMDFINSISIENLENGVFAVEEIKGHLAYQGKWLNFEPGENHEGSEYLENPFRIVWGLSLRSQKGVMSDGSMFSKYLSPIVVPSWAAIDIDYPEDLIVAHSFLEKYLEFEAQL